MAVISALNSITVCLQYCIAQRRSCPSITVHGLTFEPPEPADLVEDVFELQIRPPRPVGGNIIMLNGVSVFYTVEKGKLIIFIHKLYEINKSIEEKDLLARPLEKIVPE